MEVTKWLRLKPSVQVDMKCPDELQQLTSDDQFWPVRLAQGFVVSRQPGNVG